MSLDSTVRDMAAAVDKGQMDHDAAAFALTAWASYNLTGGLDPEKASKLIADKQQKK